MISGSQSAHTKRQSNAIDCSTKENALNHPRTKIGVASTGGEGAPKVSRPMTTAGKWSVMIVWVERDV